MVLTPFKKILLVASDVFPQQIIPGNTYVKHISAVNSIFPSLYELNPDLIILDYDFIGNKIEKVIRRIKINKFYNKLKICCYKSVPNEKTDSLLKALGVDHLFYQEDILKPKKNKKGLNNLNTILNASIMKWLPAFRIEQLNPPKY